jgi:hypothetical protein
MKRRLNKFDGIPREQFAFHMLESEWRFNHRSTFADDLKKTVPFTKLTGQDPSLTHLVIVLVHIQKQGPSA